MRVAVLRFPGSNCDADTLRVCAAVGADPYYVWHREESLNSADVVILPGGFAYGDHLRAGAIARFSPIMRSVVDFARAGKPVLGICNGFQVLCEAGLLPGALVRNSCLTFLSRPLSVAFEANDTPFTSGYTPGDTFDIPVAHGEGRFVASREALEELEADGRVVARYASDNPNGSMNAVAGITNESRNVVGLMPHPERAAYQILGETRGLTMFESMMRHAEVA